MENDKVMIRPAERGEWEACMNLAFKVFMRFEAPVYTREGIEHFYEFVTDERLRSMFYEGIYILHVAVCEGEIVGIISVRSNTHISLLFVEESCHKQGIGRKLIESMKQYAKEHRFDKLTVNSSPYAVEFYHRLGFTDLDDMQSQDGILFTPMILKL